MFPLAHIYAAKEASGLIEPAFVVGSVLPDIAYTGIISFERSHSMAEEFKQHLQLNHPEWASMGEGVILHIKPIGLDFHSDVNYENSGMGWAYNLSKPFVRKVEECCGVAGRTAVVAAHWFVEMAVDIHLAGERLDMFGLLKSSMGTVGPDAVSKILSGFVSKDEREVKPPVEEFFLKLGEYEPTSIAGALEFYSWINRKMFLKDIEKQLGQRILQKAVNLTRQEYGKFLPGSIEKMRRNYESYMLL